MIFNSISTQYRRSAIGLIALGSLLSFALGQHVGHGHTESLSVAHTHSVPIVTMRASGAIGTAVVTQPNRPLLQSATTGTSTASQGTHTQQKHGHGHGKGDSLVTLVTTDHSHGDHHGSDK
ncbi:MAG: hypothetical protein ACXVDA_22415, partial [Ktedonobacterales bacterium]